MSEVLERRVLALKYRPKKFEDLVGQTTISQTLSLALDTNRLSHAYLFSGLRGSGKTSTARIMAKALLCSNGPTSKPCEVCPNCVSANSNRHLDIIEMDAASNRGIDDIKDLIEHTKYKPSSARYKVFIIDEVHMLTTQAFNALLKTLEEPPAFVKFILATTDPLKLPATILSRTQHFRFNKIAHTDVVHHLGHILNEEKIDFQKEALDIIARSGNGSLRDTLTLLDQAIIFSKGSVNTTSVVDMLGLIDPKIMDNIFEVILNRSDINKIVKLLENYEVSQICDEMSIYLKEKMIHKDSKFSMLLFDRFFRIIGDAKHLLTLNSDDGFVLILTLMKMVEATNIRTIDEIINQVEKIPVTKEDKVKVEQKPLVKEIIKEEPKKEELIVQKTEIAEEIVEKVEEAKTENSTLEIKDFSTPFDEFVEEPIKEEKKEIIEVKEEVFIEPIEEKQALIDYNQEIEVVPFEEEHLEEEIGDERYELLISKVYDRDYALGECFEKNFVFESYENNKLTIISYAQGEERNFLYKHFGIIKTFIQDIYGHEVELDFKKKDNPPINEKKNDEKLEEIEEDVSSEVSSMIEDVEMGAGCVADITKSSVEEPSQKELQLNDILNSKMLNKAKEIFDVKKIIVKSRS